MTSHTQNPPLFGHQPPPMGGTSNGIPATGLPPEIARPMVTGPTPPVRPGRPYVEHTLPADKMGMSWAGSQFGDGDRTFRMCELRIRDKEAAAKRAGSNQARLSTELIFGSIAQVGGWPTDKARDALEAWWDAIGPRAQRLVEAAWIALNSVEEADVATFLGAGKPHAG